MNYPPELRKGIVTHNMNYPPELRKGIVTARIKIYIYH
jgi:hypothetical protein